MTLDKTFIEKVHKTARYFGKDKRLQEDLAQEVLLNYLEYEHKHGTASKQTIRQGFLDAYRKLNPKLVSISQDFELFLQESEEADDLGLPKASLKAFLSTLKIPEHFVFHLTYREEWTRAKVAACGGCSIQRVDQLLASIRKSARVFAKDQKAKKRLAAMRARVDAATKV